MDTPPIRTYSLNHPKAGYLSFSIPVHSPTDVDAYLRRQLAGLEAAERMKLHGDLMKQALEMWSGYALWVGDPEEARLQLREDPEIQAWLRAEKDACALDTLFVEII